jgi:hypothetical protein
MMTTTRGKDIMMRKQRMMIVEDEQRERDTQRCNAEDTVAEVCD